MIQSMIDDSYAWFVDLVADRRKLPRPDALLLADGRIFTGRQALKAKLVDKLGGEDEIRAFLTEKKVSKDLPIVDWEAPARPCLLASARWSATGSRCWDMTLFRQ